MTISATMPAVAHVAVTVTDLDTSQEWVKPVLDEDTGPLLGLHGFPP